MSGVEYEITAGNDVAACQNGTITALKSGDATLSLKLDQNTVTITVKVH